MGRSFKKRSLIVVLVTVVATFSLATAAFAAVGVNLDQCANGSDGKTSPCDWQNGDLNAQNSQWHEGDGVPFRVVFTSLTAGDHSFHINYDFLDAGKHAYD